MNAAGRNRFSSSLNGSELVVLFQSQTVDDFAGAKGLKLVLHQVQVSASNLHFDQDPTSARPVKVYALSRGL